MTTATETALPTTKKIEQMSDHERLVALRLLDRRKSKVSKLWNGKVSEARTSAEHLVEAEVPKRDAECRQRLEAIKTALDECDDMKAKRKSAVDAIKSAWSEILYAAPATAEQLELGATRAPITKVAIVELRAAYNDAVADDAAAQEKGETPKLPPEKQADMDDLRAKLDAMMADSGLDSISFGDEITADQTDPDAEVDEEDDEPEEKTAANTSGRGPSKGRGKAKLSAVPTH